MRFIGCLVAMGVLLVACGDGGPSGDTATTTSTTSAAGGAGGSQGALGGGGSGGQAAAPDAPQLDLLMKMSGALHVMWTNTQSDCDSVRIERKTDTEAWAEKYSVPGTVDNKMDGTATANTMYTFRLRCEKGGSFSDYSNEMSRNPTL